MRDGFKNFEKNQAFPIHASLYDSEVDKDSEKPGGYFTKKLYDDDESGEEGEEEEEEEESSDDGTNPGRSPSPPQKKSRLRGRMGKDGNINGFCRTNPQYRAHYKLARIREK